MAAARDGGACPCGSGRTLGACCGRLHAGAMAPSPEALMRSRYAAYAVGAVDYVLDTTHPDGPRWRADRGAWRRDVSRFCAETAFLGLQVHGAGFDPDGAAWVEFTARLTQNGGDASFRERSRFRPHRGRWAYLDGAPRDLARNVGRPAGTPR
jgi:SEC-C motif-containing protein